MGITAATITKLYLDITRRHQKNAMGSMPKRTLLELLLLETLKLDKEANTEWFPGKFFAFR